MFKGISFCQLIPSIFYKTAFYSFQEADILVCRCYGRYVDGKKSSQDRFYHISYIHENYLC